MNLADVRVIEPCLSLGFAQKALALAQFGAGQAFDAQELDGDQALQSRIARFEHAAHAASAQKVEDLKAFPIGK